MSDPVETSLAAQIKTVLVNNGVDIDGGSFHSWRCFDKERYPDPCTCTDEVVAEIMEAVAAAAADPVEDGPLAAAFLDEMAAWSIQTFGPGTRLDGVLDHMAKEIEEARAKPGDVSEWADLAILAFDGAQRQGITGQQFIDAYRAKFAKNRSRSWPDWRTAEPGKAIEHDRSSDE